MARNWTGLMDRIRQVAENRECFTVNDLGEALEIKTYKEKARIKNGVGWLRRTGEIQSIRPGLYRYRAVARKRTKMDIIWHLVRSNRHFSTDEIERLSGAARYTVNEYLNCLCKLEYIRRLKPGHYRLVCDPGPDTPVNADKCKKLRQGRKKEAGGGIQNAKGR